MQVTNDTYDQAVESDFRRLSWGLRASFDKAFDDSVTFFTLDVSQLDGIDILAGDGNIITEWDKYKYLNYSDRVISIEVNRQETEPYSLTSAYADIVVNNFDGYFTPGSDSPVGEFILPKRPFRLFMGFKDQDLPQFVGMNTTMPAIDKKARTASFHLVDFLTYLYDQDVSETIMLQNKRTDEILDVLLQGMGLLTNQFVLDSGINKVPFFYVEKGEKFGTVVKKLMEAEIGRFYMDEVGIVVFKNRYNYDETPVLSFSDPSSVDYNISSEDSVINTVQISVPVRRVQELQSIWRNSEPYLIQPGQTIDIFTEYSDPCTVVNNPTIQPTPILDSYFIGSIDEGGDIPYTSMTLDASFRYAKWGIFTLKNTGSTPAYIHTLELFGTPAKIIDTLKVREINQDSIDKFEERVYQIENEYIQDADQALSRSALLLNDFAEYGSLVDLTPKSNFALQLGDTIEIDLDGINGLYQIMKITNSIASGRSTQRVRGKKKIIVPLFILDQSQLDGTDQLAP